MRKGFTLLELSIVLVIIGLIIGGITVGQDLIRSAEINAIAREYSKYKVAVNSFKLKYDALPGDMVNATDYWGIAGGTGSDATCYNTVSTDEATCNGDGNGDIGSSGGDFWEHYRAWQHLSNAEIIPGSFTGRSDGGTGSNNYASIGVNVPEGPIGGTGFNFHHFDRDYPGSGTWFPGTYGNFLFFGTEVTNDTTIGNVLTPPELGGLDEKYDDGLPGKGKFKCRRANAGTASGCVTATDPDTSLYQLSITTLNCRIIMLLE